MKNWSGADMRCEKCNRYLPDRCICEGLSQEQRSILQEQVSSVLDDTVEHGHSEIYEWTALDIVVSLLMDDEDLAQHPVDTLIPFAEVWLVMQMSHRECYRELQDKWVTEDDLNSEDFEAKYMHFSVNDMRKELIKYRNAKAR